MKSSVSPEWTICLPARRSTVRGHAIGISPCAASRLTNKQRAWLRDFSRRWKSAHAFAKTIQEWIGFGIGGNPEPGGGRVRTERLTASQIGTVALVTAMEQGSLTAQREDQLSR